MSDRHNHEAESPSAVTASISERQQSTEFYRDVIAAVPDGLTVLDTQGVLVYASPRARAIYRTGEQDLVGTTFTTWVAPEFVVMADEQFCRLRMTQQPEVPTTYRMLTLAGQEFWAELSSAPIVDAAGVVTGYAVLTRELSDHRRAEAMLGDLFDHAPFPVSVSRLDDGAILFINQRGALLFGINRGEALTRRVSEFYVEPQQRTMIVDLVRTHGSVDHLEVELKNAEGVPFWADLSLTLTSFREQPALFAAFIDITERKRAEQELRASQEKFSRLFQANPDAIVITALDGGRIIDANDAFLVLTGRTRQEILGRTTVDLGLLPNVTQRDALADTVAAKGMIRDLELRFLNRQGELRVVSVVTERLDIDGVACLVSIGRDTTERQLAEEALRQSEERHRLLADHASDVIWTMDLEGHFTYISPSVERLRGYTAEEVMRQSMNEVLTPESAVRVKKRLAETTAAIKSGRRMRGGRSEIEQPCKDGSTVWTEVTTSGIYNPAGDFVGVLGVTRDISERRRQEAEILQLTASLEQRVEERTAQLVAANGELEKASRMKDEFLATMSHELRTPLTGVLSMAEVLQEQVYGPLNERQLKCALTIASSGKHLLALINEILDLSKISVGQLDLVMSNFDVDSVCQSSLHMIQELGLRKQQSIEYAIDPVGLEQFGDPRRLRQMLVNLLSNAVKFTPLGGRLGLEVCGDPVAATITFRVWDTGIGIAADDIPKLFQPFVQLDSRLSREYGGTGLGLALVRRLAELQNGHVGVDSAPGAGSRFWVTLPWQTVPTSLDNNPSQPSDVEPPRRISMAHILLAEDNEMNAAVLSDYLSDHGHQVSIVADGAQALAQTEAVRPDLILMDIHMPGMDGLEAIRRLRAHPDGSIARIPIIALTALAMPADRIRCLAAGASAYISKPVNLRTLFSVIDEQLAAQSQFTKMKIQNPITR